MNKLILMKDLTLNLPARILTLVVICAVLTSLFPYRAYSHNDIAVANNCTFQVNPQHQTLYCLEKYTPENIPQPIVYSSCGPIQTLTHEDNYLDLGCTSNGFTGYFMTPNWQSFKIKGDGGVDVTGAPNSILVEGANNALVSVDAESTVQHSIVVPAEGYLSFDWSYIGGSNLFSHAFSLIINDQTVPLASPYTKSGHYFSELLEPGDQVGFKLNNIAGKDQLAFKIEDFQFLTNAIGVTRRNWTAEDTQGNSAQFIQIITFERATLSDVIFPGDLDGLQNPALNNSSSNLPTRTGYPVIDKDGNPNTTTDQYRLNENDCAFEVKWIDSEQQDGAYQLIQRQWIITDWCSGSIMEETQIIKIASTPNSKGIPSDYNVFSGNDTVSERSNGHYGQPATPPKSSNSIGYSKSTSTTLSHTSETLYHPLTDDDF